MKHDTPHKTITPQPLKHTNYDLLKTMVSTGLPVLITGGAGNGKSHSVQQLATELGTNFEALSVGEQTTVSQIMGYTDVNGKYVETGFYRTFKYGGIFLLDEIDAGNPNVLLAINTAIANNFASFPHELVEGHKDFRLVTTANTYGTGAGSQYVGRNKLDKATLNRFVVLDWELDTNLEDKLVGNKDWLAVVYKARELAVDIEGVLISQRTSTYGDKLLKAGVSIEDTFKSLVTAPLDEYSTNLLNKAMKEYSISAELTMLLDLLTKEESEAIELLRRYSTDNLLLDTLADMTETSNRLSDKQKEDIKALFRKTIVTNFYTTYYNAVDRLISLLQTDGYTTDVLLELDVITEHTNCTYLREELLKLPIRALQGLSATILTISLSKRFTKLLKAIISDAIALNEQELLVAGASVLITKGAHIGTIGTVLGVERSNVSIALPNDVVTISTQSVRVL